MELLKYITEPYRHQHQVVLYGLEHSRVGILCDMGTGKTKAVIDIARNRAYQAGAARDNPFTVLVIAPRSILENWKREVAAHSGARAVVLSGTRKKRLEALRHDIAGKGLSRDQKSGLWFYIINYEAVLSLWEELMDRRFSMIIADESTYIKNSMARRSKLVTKIAGRIPYRAIMTGTPITQSPLDIFSQFKFLDGGATFGYSFIAFRNKYCIPVTLKCPEGHVLQKAGKLVTQDKDGTYSLYCPRCLCKYEVGKEAKGWEWELKPGALEDLSTLIYTKAIRFTKEECLDLPPKVYEARYVEMNAVEKKLYTEMCSSMRTELDGKNVSAQIILTKLMRLSQITSGYVKDEDGAIHQINAASKLRELDFLLDEISGQAIIWCRFIPNIEAIAGILQKRGEKYVTFYGNTAPEDRDAAIDAFQKGDARYFVGQTETGGMGINLTAASHEVYYSMGFSLISRLQSEDRAHRIGQQKKLTITDLVVPGSIDEVILQAVREKKRIADFVVEWWRKNSKKGRRRRNGKTGHAADGRNGRAGQGASRAARPQRPPERGT